MGDWHPAIVQCYSGYKADERPLAFRVGLQALKVLKIIDSRRDPDHSYFKVQTEEGGLFLLKHLQTEDTWMVMRLQNSRSGTA